MHIHIAQFKKALCALVHVTEQVYGSDVTRPDLVIDRFLSGKQLASSVRPSVRPSVCPSDCFHSFF